MWRTQSTVSLFALLRHAGGCSSINTRKMQSLAAPGHAAEPPASAPQALLPSTYAWHTFYGSDMNDFVRGIATDALGNIYLAGTSNASWQGPQGQLPLHAFGSLTDILVVKLSANGDYVWHTFYGEGGQEGGNDIAIDQAGNLYMVGYSGYNWLGDHGASPLHPYWSSDDLTVLKLDNNGGYLWHTFYGGGGSVYSDDNGKRIALDEQGNLYVAGTSQSLWLGDGNTQPLHAHSGSEDIAVLKLTNAGGYAWHTFYGSSADDNGADIAVDGQGNLVILGESVGSWLGDQAHLRCTPTRTATIWLFLS